ncbi:hypothetical protein C8Q70DRAFT_1031151 [Cubamyces menziesii]|nr:hypothetical protein C8Q70DRAFT_1031151 [Cubamyces menziesii]
MCSHRDCDPDETALIASSLTRPTLTTQHHCASLLCMFDGVGYMTFSCYRVARRAFTSQSYMGTPMTK